MSRLLNLLLCVVLLAAGGYAIHRLNRDGAMDGPSAASGSGSVAADHAASGDGTAGAHGGHRLVDGELALELLIHERGTPPRLRVYPSRDGQPLPPGEVTLEVTLNRLGGRADELTFSAREDYLESEQIVGEPHSFDLDVAAVVDGVRHAWTYAQHEGRTRIAPEMAAAAGISIEHAGPAQIVRTVTLQGRVRADPGRVRQIRARYAGIILSAEAAVGDRVAAGQALARVESDESLQAYTITSPLDGIVVEQHAGTGEAIDREPIYTLANFDRVWVDLAVFPGERAQVRVNQAVTLETLDGGARRTARIGYLSPTGDVHSQALVARVYLDSPGAAWRPGLAVTGQVEIERADVALAVRTAALQRFRSFDVVFARFDDVYEVRMLELGRSDGTWSEVLSGIAAGTAYVVDNSYLVKADIEKAQAAHPH